MAPKLIIFASGTKTGGGSGFLKLVEHVERGNLLVEVVAVVSNWGSGGVSKKAAASNVPFEHFRAPHTAQRYEELVEKYSAEWVAMSGWLKLVPMRQGHNTTGLHPSRTFNIHPGPLPTFGGPGMWGAHIHSAVAAALQRGELAATQVTMHFMTAEYDRGPVFLRVNVPLETGDSAETVAQKANSKEHEVQWIGTQAVVSGLVKWDGADPATLQLPSDWEYLDNVIC
eukprot:Platyproteum_vivax@DN4347_c0_g1_i1.p2